MMDLMQLLGNRILWAGSEESLMQVARSLMPELNEPIMRAALMERQEHENKRSKAAQSRVDRVAKIRAQVGAVAGGDLRVSFDDDGYEDDDDERFHFHSATYRAEGNTAVIGVKGPLVNSDAWYVKFFGQVGYPHIIDQLLRAYSDPAVTNVLIDANTPGGAVNGITAVTDAITAVSAFKPVSTYADGLLCSGGYWLAASTENIMVSDLTEAGSIGVIMTHLEYSKALEKQGITATVVREGKYKALVSAYEPLTAEALSQIKHSMGVIYDAFIAHVAYGRNVSAEYADKTMGEGRTFWGAEGLAVRMVDAVGDFSRAVAFSRHLADTRVQTATFSH
jgi:signal peptide peptidase SppA